MPEPTTTTETPTGDPELTQIEDELKGLLEEKQRLQAEEQAIRAQKQRINKLEERLAGEENIDEAINLEDIEERLQEIEQQRATTGAPSATAEEHRNLRKTFPIAQQANQRITELVGHELETLITTDRQRQLERQYGPGRVGEFRAFLNGEHDFDIVMDQDLGPQTKHNWKQEAARRLSSLGLKSVAATGVAAGVGGTFAILTGGAALLPIAYGLGANIGVRTAFEAGRALFGKSERQLREKMLTSRIETVKEQKQLADELAKTPRHEQEAVFNQKLSELVDKLYQGESEEVKGWRQELAGREKKIGRAEEWAAFLASFTASTYGVLTGKQALVEQFAQAEKEKMQKTLEQGGKVLLDIDKANPHEIARMGLQETHHWVQKIGEQYYFFYSKAESLAHNATKHILDAASVAKITETIAQATRAAAEQAAKGEIAARLTAMFTGWAALSVGKWQVEALGARRNAQRLTDAELRDKSRLDRLQAVMPQPETPAATPAPEPAVESPGAEEQAQEIYEALKYKGEPIPEKDDVYEIEVEIDGIRKTMRFQIEAITGVTVTGKLIDPANGKRIAKELSLKTLVDSGRLVEESVQKRSRRVVLERWKKDHDIGPDTIDSSKHLEIIVPVSDIRGSVIEAGRQLRFVKFNEEKGTVTVVDTADPRKPELVVDLAQLDQDHAQIITNPEE